MLDNTCSVLSIVKWYKALVPANIHAALMPPMSCVFHRVLGLMALLNLQPFIKQAVTGRTK